jgi:hypothetical protein
MDELVSPVFAHIGVEVYEYTNHGFITQRRRQE